MDTHEKGHIHDNALEGENDNAELTWPDDYIAELNMEALRREAEQQAVDDAFKKILG
jgi:hypothetical protein